MRFYLSPILAAAIGAAGCGPSDPVLARVGPRAVKASAFLREVGGVPFSSQAYLRTPAGRRELLELLVRRKIIFLEAKKESDPETERFAKALKAEYRQRQQQLKQSYADERERLMVGRFTQRLKEGPTRVTDEEVLSFWETESEVRASHILVSDRKLSEDIHRKLIAGGKFEALAKQYSEDTGSAAKGGDAGYLLRGSLVPAFENGLFPLKTGETSGVVPSPYGFHIIRRTGARKLSGMALDDALKTRIRQAIESRKLQTWFDDARRRHPVTVREAALDNLAFPSPPGETPPAPAEPAR
jgi:hypothetical protein